MALSRYPSSAGSNNWAKSISGRFLPEDDTESISRETMAGSEYGPLSSEEPGNGFGRDDLPSEFWDDVVDRGLYPEDTSQWLTRLERGADERVVQTFKKGKPVPLRDDMPTPLVGLVFLPGADKPTVARLEESNMVEKEPDQKDSMWRQNTASALLNGRTVNRDLTFHNEDHTWKVIKACQYNSNAPFSSPREYNRDTVTINSDKIKLVNELRNPQNGMHFEGELKYDLSATLVEVDEGSLVRLIQHFHHLVSSKKTSSDDERYQLENMMEDARFFCLRSPILFRMNTRLRIIESADIRYGTDDEYGFRNTYTSKGIQRLVSVSAAYFNALDPAHVNSEISAQSSVRPRFLQMLVLLLSMFSGEDLRQMADFLRTTYSIKPDRGDLELLILKVIPLTSINSEVFLSALIPAITGREVEKYGRHGQWKEHCWEELLKELARRGYLLPGTVNDLGHDKLSWLLRWPKKGIHSSQAFGRLQYNGDSVEGFNEIVPIRTGLEPEMTEMTVYLHQIDQPYIIHARDFEQIRNLEEGTYMMREAGDEGREFELSIRSEPLNDVANDAIRLVNKTFKRINADTSRSSSRALSRRISFLGRDHRTPTIISQELPAAALITRHEVRLEGTDMPIAIAWKCDGRLTSRMFMLQCLSRPVRKIEGVLRWFERLTRGRFGQHDSQYREVKALVARHETVIQHQKNTRKYPDNPIRKSVHPSDNSFAIQPTQWYEYWSKYENEHLLINAQRDMVESVVWSIEGTQAEIKLARSSTKFTVAPLRPDLYNTRNAREEEIQPRDIVLLVGRYMMVLAVSSNVPDETSQGEQKYEAMNWMEIQSVDEDAGQRRGRNKSAVQRPLSVIV